MVERISSEEPDQERVPKSSATAITRVFVLYTGGTIGMAPEDPNNPESALVPQPLEKLLKYVPGLGDEGIGLGYESLPKALDSTEVRAEHWLQMAQVIEKVYDEYDGFVVLHGTDTMAYTTSALSFIMENLAKPVVVTGSQLPISAPRTDAIQNLVAAIYIAGYKATHLPLIPEVVLCFADRVLRGNRVRKISTAAWTGFDSPNFPPLAKIGEHIVVNQDLLRPLPDTAKEKFFVHRQLVTDALAIDVFPGLRAGHLDALLRADDISGMILKTFGVGNCPEALWDSIGEAIEGRSGRPPKLLLNVTQCLQGSVEMGRYAASSGLLERGVVSGMDMTPEAALVKMFWVLGTFRDPEERKIQLQIDQRGEQSENLFDIRFIGVDQRIDPKLSHDFSERVDGRFLKDRLSRAVLRLSDVRFPDLKPDEEVSFRAFLNLPAAVTDPDSEDAQMYLAADFSSQIKEGEGMSFIQDVTETVQQVVRQGPPVGLSLLSSSNFQLKGAYLALFARS